MAGSLGTAPHRTKSGVWSTASGRKLTTAGQQYWEKAYRQGRTDGMGHMRAAPEVAAANARTRANQHIPQQTASAYKGPPKKPSFDTAVRAAKGDKQAKQQLRVYELHKQAEKNAAFVSQRQSDINLFGQGVGSVYKSAAKGRVISPIGQALINVASPVEAGKAAFREAKKGHFAAAGVSALGAVPVGRGPRAIGAIEKAIKAEREAKVAEAGLAGRRVLTAGEKVQQVPRARSRITQRVIENPVDRLSQRFPKAPLIGSESRVAKHAGRSQVELSRRERVIAQNHARALPKEGSPSDVAHFWWAQLPPHLRNVQGLRLVRDRQAAELARITSPEHVATLNKRRATTKLAGLPEQARVTAASVQRLDEIIAKPPKLEPKVIQAVHALSGERQKTLTQVGLLTAERATERKGLLARSLGHEPTGAEAFIGHRLEQPRGSFGMRSPGYGKPRYPEGVGKENKLVRVTNGSVRQSTHVAHQDWMASQTYRETLRARRDLAAMGKPFEGHLPADHGIVNPEGKVIPKEWRTDQLAKIAGEHADPEEVRKASEGLIKNFLGDSTNWEHVVEEAKKTGTFDKLRVVHKDISDRYYQQFLPVARAGKGGRIYDRAIDATAASLIFARLGYVPKNLLQNAVMIAPHQGAAALFNMPRAAQLIPHPGQADLDNKLLHLLASEVGGGASGAIAQEATMKKVLGAPAQAMTNIADTIPRMSAFIHEAAAEGVIPRFSFHLSDKDKQALYNLLTDPAKRAQLNDVMHRTRDAMADFNRLNPSQRRWMRRFLIVPGWLVAGTRYPLHFAATHPLRSAALAYVGAGEPGAPKQLQVNRPIDEYLAKGLPPYLQGVGAGKGQIERVQSVMPASLPADIAFAAKQGNPLTAASYANPLPEAAWNIANSTVQTSSGESKKVPQMEAFTRNLQRLAPGESFVQQEITGSKNPRSIYADQSRLGVLKKELGVLPVKINKANAERASYSARGMTQSVQVVDDKTKLLAAIKTAGEKPSKVLLDAYNLRLERAQRLDGIHAHGLSYQQKAYKSDVELMLKHKLITPAEAKSTLAAAARADEETLKSWRRWLTDHKFQGDTIRDVKHYLRSKS